MAITVHQERGGRSDELTYGNAEAGGEIHLRYTRDELRAALTGDVEAGGHYELLV